MGYRGCITHPFVDQYYSSSKKIKQLKREDGSSCYVKKILGTEQEALYNEVLYHEILKVDVNPLFLNKARQTTTDFFYNPTGSIQSVGSTEKRSIALLSRNRFTEEGLSKLVNYQRNRERTDS